MKIKYEEPRLDFFVLDDVIRTSLGDGDVTEGGTTLWPTGATGTEVE